MREFTEIYKKKFEASEELKSVGTSVQKAMITKNNELSELAVLQKIDTETNRHCRRSSKF